MRTATSALTSGLGRPAGRPTTFGPAQSARFETIVQRSSERLVQMLDLVFLDRELAADAAQDAFVQLYLHWDEVGGSAEPEAWVYRVAVNRCKDHRRRLARAGRLFSRLAATSRAEEHGDGWEPDDELATILRRLPARQRVAVALYYQLDMSVAEVAHTMGISEGAVSSHLDRARRTLKEVLEVQR